MDISKEKREELLKAQQGEINGVETYRRLSEIVHNESDRQIFKELAADEGRHAAVFKQYTGTVLMPQRTQANAVAALYRLLGKRILYPLIAQGEYAAIPGYEKMMKEFPEVEAVKNDEKRHGDTVRALLKNGEYKDRPILPFMICGLTIVLLLKKCSGVFCNKEE